MAGKKESKFFGCYILYIPIYILLPSSYNYESIVRKLEQGRLILSFFLLKMWYSWLTQCRMVTQMEVCWRSRTYFRICTFMFILYGANKYGEITCLARIAWSDLQNSWLVSLQEINFNDVFSASTYIHKITGTWERMKIKKTKELSFKASFFLVPNSRLIILAH